MLNRLKRIYHNDSYDTARPVGSYWEWAVRSPVADPALEGDMVADVAIIGAGYTGLSAALHLVRDFGRTPVILDAAQVGWGASGRNAGFNCMGGGKIGDAAYRAQWGAADLELFYRTQVRATEVVAEILDSAGIDADRQPTGEWAMAHRVKDFEGFVEDAARLKRVAGVSSELVSKDALRERGVNGAGFEGAMVTDTGFCLNPRKYVFGLADAVRKAGGRIFGDSAVLSITRLADGRFALGTAKGRVVAERLILAGNGYNAENLPDWLGGRYMPVVSHIMVTEPMGDNLLAAQGWQVNQMSCDTRKMLHYFRLLPDGRMLFGMRGTPNLGPRDRARMPGDVRGHFDAMFPEWRGVKTDFHWSGLICVSRKLLPYVGPLGDWAGAFTALAYHGNGVSMASYCGKLLAGMVAERPYGEPMPDGLRAPLERYPLAGVRRWGLPLAFKWYGLKDR
jgi:glycine/D-amino acid oxidase-like deaminating enzyme